MSFPDKWCLITSQPLPVFHLTFLCCTLSPNNTKRLTDIKFMCQ